MGGSGARRAGRLLPAARLLACGGDLAGGGGFAVAAGTFSNTENGVVCSRFDGDVEEVCRWFQERYAPATWLGAELRERGCGVAVLGPTPESRRLYAQFGFTVTPLRDGVVYLPLEPAGR